MEVEYVVNEGGTSGSAGGETRDENFILPETEKAINAIIGEFQIFFYASRLVLQVVYLVYLGFRIWFRDQLFVPSVVMLAICIVQLFFLLGGIKKRRMNPVFAWTFRISRRIVSLSIAAIIFFDVFIAKDIISRWQGIIAVLICLGWILSLSGDVFEMTVPRYARMILDSFKRDIEISSLASRSFDRVKKAAGKAAREKTREKLRSLKNWFHDVMWME